MCGICGIIDADAAPSERDLLAMRDALTHRGPDDAGSVLRRGAALAACRLSILDLSDQAHMPMADENEAVWLVYNGEIYNFAELRRELEGRGHHFRSSGDTEVVLRAYLEWGEDCPSHLEGMFAFAVWDERRRKLFAARDRLGVKPFFFFHEDGRFAFASEIHALYELSPPSADRIDPVALDFYLGFGYVPPDRCLVAGIRKLPPAHKLALDADGLRVERYWQLDFAPNPEIGVDQALEEWDDLFGSAVARRLRSDVPLGCFLSGGIDSGLVTAVAAQRSDRPIHTFSVGFGDGGVADERPLARLVAERYGTVHTELSVDPTDRSLLPELLRHVGEPFADVGCLPMLQISRAARRHITVALSGDGGDESFGGYASVMAAQSAERVRRSVPAPLLKALALAARLPGASGIPAVDRGRRFLEGFVDAPLVRHFGFADHWTPDHRARLYSGSCLERFDPGDVDDIVSSFMPPASAGLADAQQHLFTDLGLRLPGDYLTKVDVASSAASLEVRSPFLDQRVVEWAARLPLEVKLAGGQSKGLLRLHAEKLLPPELVRAPKRGFAPDVGAWLRSEWSGWTEHLIHDSRTVAAGLFDGAALQRVADAHLAGRERHGQRLWIYMALEIWWRIFVSREDPL
jgi:asparagine synthase (glutamine-hydrolysing)